MLEALVTLFTVTVMVTPTIQEVLEPQPADGWSSPIATPYEPPRVEAHVHPREATWDRVAQCESGGDWSINTGNGFYGGLQFTLRSWQWVGGSGYPHQATKSEQIRRAEKLLSLQGWGAWPACSRKLGLRP